MDPDKKEAPHTIIGSQVAGQEYVRAMLRYLPSDAVGLFVPEASIGAVREDLYRLEDNEGRKANTGNVLFAPTLPCDAVICNSVAARDACVNLLNRAKENLYQAGSCTLQSHFRLEVIPLGVDTDLYRPRDRQDCRRLLGLPQDKRLLLYFGRIDPVTKGDQNPLLLAFAELVRKHGNSLILVLAGNTRQSTVDLVQHVAAKIGIEQQVLIRIQPGIEEAPLYYSAADVFVSTVETLQESFGIAPLEAMASGLPVVVSDWPGFRDTVSHGEAGFRVKTYWTDCNATTSLLAPLYDWPHDHFHASQTIAVDTAELYHYLDTLISNPDLCCRMGQTAREHVLKHFQWRTIIEHTYALWQELTDVARTLPPPSPTRASLVRPDYFHDFKHYASAILDETTALQVTERGRNARQTLAAFLVHPQMQSRLNPAVLHVILRFVKAGNLFRQTVTLPEVADRIAQKYHLSSDAARTHVMWLLKYGFLRVG